jgi:Diadenosine tetraphosphate (Ap4A) hydrolase and other HIT family hydrolases
MATVFEMIIKGEIPSVKLYEDDKCIVILDINPVAKGHSLVISKEVYPTIEDCPAELLSHLITVAKKNQRAAEVEAGCGCDQCPDQQRTGGRPGSAPPAHPRYPQIQKRRTEVRIFT